MKKQFILSMVAIMSAAGIGAAHAVDGTINFTGEVTADTCTIDIDDQTNPTLSLGSVNTTALAKTGDTGPATNFMLNLTSCPTTVTAVNITFSGNKDSAMASAFKNEAIENAASNVGVQIYDVSKASVSPAQIIDITDYLTSDESSSIKEAHIPFTARMIAVSDSATAGALISHADYTISYQ
ncbi:fimbrial protein [Pseudescherichia sp.]|uniref:fimbrial protein n=1 Tax=Pseudescherichia sp. TaxID=2055881 RepID=UPI00289B5EB7|nr:fimbrial protein [Pseudescherichia sp.]